MLVKKALQGRTLLLNSHFFSHVFVFVFVSEELTEAWLRSFLSLSGRKMLNLIMLLVESLVPRLFDNLAEIELNQNTRTLQGYCSLSSPEKCLPSG